MTKNELVRAIKADVEGATIKDITVITDALFESVKAAVAKGEKLTIVGFGTFEPAERAARNGVNPQTGEKIEIASSKTCKFKPGKAFKEAMNA